MNSTHTVAVLAVLAVVSARAVTRADSVCMGDCDGNGAVVVSEIVTCVAIALGTRPLAACEGVDANNDRQVSVDELTQSIVNVLEGCGLQDASPCILRTDCRSKHCVDSVCCDEECERGRCTRPDRLGMCTPLLDAGEQCTTNLDCLSEVCDPIGICCERECSTGCGLDGRCVVTGR
jgi:hypothetical protein